MKDLGPAPQRFAEGRRADRHDHEFLEIDAIVGVRAAIDDVHHRHRQDRRPDPAHVAEQRQPARIGRRAGRGKTDPEDGIGAEAALVVAAVELDHQRVDLGLVLGFVADDGVGDLAIDRGDRLPDPLAAPALGIAVALLDRFMDPGRGARGHRRAALAAVLERDVDLDRRIAAAVEDLAGVDVDDRGHLRGSSGVREVVGPYTPRAEACNLSTSDRNARRRPRVVSATRGGTYGSRE